MTGISSDLSRREVFVVARCRVDLGGLEVQEPRIIVRGAVDGYLAPREGHTTPDTLDPQVLKQSFEDGRVSVKWGIRYPAQLNATPHTSGAVYGKKKKWAERKNRQEGRRRVRQGGSANLHRMGIVAESLTASHRGSLKIAVWLWSFCVPI